MKYPDHFSTRSNYVCHLFGYPNELHMYRQALIQIKIHRHVFKGYMCQKRADRPSFKFKSRFTGLSINNLFHHPHFISTINSNFHSSTGFAALDVVGNARIISRISGLVRKSGAHAAVIRPQNSSDIPAGRCGLSPSITFSITITSCVTSENGGFPVCTFDKSVVLSFGLGRDFYSPPDRHTHKRIHHSPVFAQISRSRRPLAETTRAPTSECSPRGSGWMRGGL